MRNPDRRWLLLFTLALMVLTSLPYLLAYQAAGSEWRFTGFLLGVDDGNSYIAKMLRGAEGDWLFRSPYSAAPQPGFLAFLPYLLLGKLTAPPAQHEQLVALFHLYRWAGAFLLAWAIDRFAAIFLTDSRPRRLAIALALAGGGLGWLAMLGLGQLWQNGVPLEFYSPESFGFLSVFSLPHLEVSRALLLLGLAAHLRPRSGRLGWLLPGLLWLLLGFFQPLTIVTGWAVLGMFVLMRAAHFRGNWSYLREDFLRALVTALISAPWVVYNFAAFQTDPYLRGWAQQNLILSPPPLDYLLAYAVMLALAVAGLPALWRNDARAATLLAGWLVAFPILAYLPYPLQRRLPEGIWVALVILGVAGLGQFTGLRRKIAVPLEWAAFLPAVFLLAGAFLSATAPQTPAFVPAEQTQAFEYLRSEAPRNSIVLASFGISNRLPAWAALRTVTGHGPESIGAAVIEPRLQQFWSSAAVEADRAALLRDLRIQYLIVDTGDETPVEQWDPSTSIYLQPVFASATGRVRVYAVREELLP